MLVFKFQKRWGEGGGGYFCYGVNYSICTMAVFIVAILIQKKAINNFIIVEPVGIGRVTPM